MAVRRRRPLIPPPYPRRNRYTPSSSGEIRSVPFSRRACGLARKLHFAPLPSSSRAARFAGLPQEAIEAGTPPFSHLAARRRHAESRSVSMRCCGKLPLGIVTHFSVEMCYDSVTFLFLSGFCEFHHQLYRRDLGQQAVELVEEPGRVNGAALSGGPQGARRHPDLITVGKHLKHSGIPGDAAHL